VDKSGDSAGPSLTSPSPRGEARATTFVPPPTATEHGEHGLRVRGRELSLRYPRPSDAPLLYSLASDPHVTRFFSWGPYRHVRQAEAWLATLPERRSAGIALELAVADSADRPIGITLLSELNRRDRRAVVGTWLGRAHWGTGANHQAKGLLAHLAFGPLDLERFGAYADINNTRSQIALERLGFRREGLLRAFTAVTANRATSQSMRCCARAGNRRG